MIRELIEKDQQGFYVAAIDLLRNADDSRGSQYLISTLVGKNLLLTALSDPALTRDQALTVARAALHTSSMVDVTLAKHLADAVTAGGASHADSQRLMEILFEISDGNRILPSLLTLARQPNPYLQSKAILMIGRANKSVKWLQNRLGDKDPRIRANAVEAIWGLDSEEARALLHRTTSDINNRVAGNALIGLYRLGDCSVIPEILKMAEHESKLFRATAAWVMGESGDPRFTKILARLIGEPNTPVRTRAFAALGQIRAATAQATQNGEWRVVGRFQRSFQKGSRRLQVEVSSLDGKQQIQVLPTNFILTEGGQHVLNYSVEARPAPEALALSFIFPRPSDPESAPFTRGVIEALRYKRSSDLWSGLPFIPARKEIQTTVVGESISFAAPESTASEDLPLSFTSDPANVRTMLLKVQPKVECTDLWKALRRAVQIEGGPARGQRHVIAFSQSDDVQSPLYPEVAAGARAAHAAVHAIAMVSNPVLENLCQITHGSFQAIHTEEEVAGVVEQTCLNLMARYTIRYEQVCPHADTLSIRVQSRAGWGEAEIPIPQQRAM